jgi:serine/threonine-protein kinase
LTWVGKVVADRYRLMEVIGKGGHSLVYRALERGGDREFAVKVLHEELPSKKELEARLEREYATLVALEGTHATRAFELCRTDGSLCLVMEFLRGQDFDAYLADIESEGQRIEVGTLVELLSPIVETLDVAHERGIVHRDLKPGNIFVLGRGGPGGVRLLDFGLAWSDAADPITLEGVVLGSPSYIAPEVWEGFPRALDLRVDVYALGAVIYRALTGEVPFPRATIREKIAAATHAARPSLHAKRPDLPRGVDDWVRQALAVDRNHRFARVSGMWRAFLVTMGLSQKGYRRGIEKS